MSMFDEERKQMGLPSVGGSSSSLSNGESIFANERARQNTNDFGTSSYSVEDSVTDQANNMISALDTADGAYSNQVKADNEARAAYQQRADEQALSDEAQMAQAQQAYADMPKYEPSLLEKTKRTASAVNEGVGTFFDSAANAASFGLFNKLLEHNDQQERIDNQDSIIGTAGEFTGMALPIGAAYATGGKLAGKALTRLAPNAPKLAQNVVRGIGAGLAYGTADEAMQAATGEQQNIGGRLGDIGKEAALFGAGDAAFGLAGKGLQKVAEKYAGTRVGDFLGKFFERPSTAVPEVEQQVHEMLALPSPRVEARMAAAAERGNLARGENVLVPAADVPANALPMGNYIKPTRLSVNPDNMLNSVMQRIKPEVEQAIAVPQRRDLLVGYIQKHTEIPREEIWNMPMKDLQELGQYVREGINVPEIAFSTARKYGYDLPSLLDRQVPSIGSRVTRDAQARTAGVYPESLPNLRQPEGFNIYARGQAAAPVLRSGLRTSIEPRVRLQSTRAETPVVAAPQATGEMRQAPRQPVDLRQSSPLRTSVQEPKVTDELKFANTVRTSQNTVEPLTAKLTETPLTGSRTSDVLNRQQAEKMIERYGREGLYSKLLSKRVKLSSSEVTAAQMLAKHYSSLGGEENLSKAIEIISKTAREGREMGQAIQALSQWNKLDAEGALLLGERQLNRGVEDTADWKKLTTAQAAPIQEAAQRIGAAKETKNLADEVLNIVTNKAQGEALTDAEKVTIKQFQDQVKTINEKTKGFLPKAKKAADATIKEVGDIKPKERTRDQVVSFLDAKAEKARQRLAAQRNIGFAAQASSNPVIDYAIIGAAHVAKGVVRIADFTEIMLRDYGQSVKPYINEMYNRSVNMFRRENGLPTIEELDRVVNVAIRRNSLTKEEAYLFKAWSNEVGFIADNKLKLEATQDLQKALKDLGDSSLGQKVSSVHTAGMLLNAVTFERNIGGGASQILLEKINKMAAVPIDWTLSKLTGERTIMFFPNNQEKMAVNYMIGTKSGWEGVSPTGTLDSYDIHPEVFGKKNPLKYLTKSLGASLQGFDHAAYRSAYGDVLATYAEQLGKAQGLTKAQIKQNMPELIKQLDQRVYDMADQAGLYATFQDETFLSLGAQFIKQGLNKITDKPAQMLTEKGLLPKKFSTEGFGLGDIVLKFARTPANLIMRGIDYSPLGIVRSMMELAPLFVNRAKFNQFEATRALSRTITGTLGLTGMGYILADAGILTGSSSMDKDVRSVQEQSGQGAYKVNWSALGRFLTSGFSYDDAKYQKGDKLMDYAWLQPAAISVAMGVNANKAWKDRASSDISGWQIAGKAILGGLATVLENPMVQGVSNVVDATTDIIKKQDATKLKNIGKGVPASFVPTLLNQARTATDNNQRETFDKSLLTEMGNLMKNKVPGLSKTLPVSYDSLGNARERIQGGQANTVSQYLTAFFSPAKMTEYQVSPEAKLVLDLMNQSGDQNVLPRIESRYIHIDQGKDKKDLRADLTAEQYSKLQQNVGQLVTTKIAEKADYLANPTISMKNKVEKVKSILTDAGKKARGDIGTQMGYKKKDIKK